MNRKIAVVISVLLSSSLLASCAQKQRTLEETKPKVTINAVTNAARPNSSSNTALKSTNTNTTAPATKITLPRRTADVAPAPTPAPEYNNNNNNEAYNPPPITVPVEDEVTVAPETTPAVTTPETTPQTATPETTPQETSAQPQTTVAGDTVPEGTTPTTQAAENQNDLATSKNQQVGDAVEVSDELNVYGSAEDAVARENVLKTYGPGVYYIYKVAENGAVNISLERGVPGAWVGSDQYLDEGRVDPGRTDEMSPPAVTTIPGDASPEPTTTTQAAPADTRFTEGQKVTLGAAVSAYGTASDAKEGVNPTREYTPGQYYIFKYSDGAVNISNAPDVPGGWISSDMNLMDSADRPEEGTTVPSGTSTQGTPQEELEETGRFALGTKVSTSEPLHVYATAADAIAGNNPLVSYPAGEYYIAQYSNGAVNISLTNNAPGGWISPGAELIKITPDIPTDIPGSVEISGDNVTLYGRVTVYSTAYDAKNRINPRYAYDAGSYFLFKTGDGAVNISTQEGTPGGWIHYEEE